jgi:hypothetical protein
MMCFWENNNEHLDVISAVNMYIIMAENFICNAF